MDILKSIMARFTEDVEKGLAKKTHDESAVKCYVTYVQDLPNGSGKYLKKRSLIEIIMGLK